MTREEILSNMELHRYEDKNNTGTRNFINMMIAQPLLNSYVKSSYAKKTGIAFYHGMETGIFNNFTFMGGHNIFGGGLFHPIFGKLTDGIKMEPIKMFSKQFQFLNRKTTSGLGFFQEADNLTDHFVDDADDLIESGFGFGKNASVLKELKATGMEFNGTDVANFNKDVLRKRIVDHLDTITDFDKMKMIARKAGIDIGYESVAKNFKRANPSKIKHARHFKQIAQEIYGEAYKPDHIREIQNALKAGSGELFEKIIDTKVVDKIFKGKIGKEVFDQARKETAEKVVAKIMKEYVETSAIENFFSSTTVRFLTGNLATGAVGTFVDVALSAASMVSSMHQDAAIGDYTNAHLNNLRERHFVGSSASQESMNSHLMISRSNVNDYYQMLNDHNVSKTYLKDMDPIQSNFEYSKVDNFTIF